MAMLFTNVCKFGNCGLQYSSLLDLLVHIEQSHIVTDPEMLKRQEMQPPQCLALSYIVKALPTDQLLRSIPQPSPIVPGSDVVSLARLRKNNTAMQPSQALGVTNDSEDDNRNPYSEDSRESTDMAASAFQFPAMDTGQSTSFAAAGSMPPPPYATLSSKDDRKLVCPVPNCKKRFKTITAVKTHARVAHLPSETEDIRVYQCTRCAKAYKTPSGLKHHMTQIHNDPPQSPVHSSSTQPLTAVSQQGPTVVNQRATAAMQVSMGAPELYTGQGVMGSTQRSVVPGANQISYLPLTTQGVSVVSAGQGATSTPLISQRRIKGPSVVAATVGQSGVTGVHRSMIAGSIKVPANHPAASTPPAQVAARQQQNMISARFGGALDRDTIHIPANSVLVPTTLQHNMVGPTVTSGAVSNVTLQLSSVAAYSKK